MYENYLWRMKHSNKPISESKHELRVTFNEPSAVSPRRTLKSAECCRQAGFPTNERGEIPGTRESILSRATYALRVFHETLNHMAQRAAIGNMLLVY